MNYEDIVGDVSSTIAVIPYETRNLLPNDCRRWQHREIRLPRRRHLGSEQTSLSVGLVILAEARTVRSIRPV